MLTAKIALFKQVITSHFLRHMQIWTRAGCGMLRRKRYNMPHGSASAADASAVCLPAEDTSHGHDAVNIWWRYYGFA